MFMTTLTVEVVFDTVICTLYIDLYMYYLIVNLILGSYSNIGFCNRMLGTVQ